MTIRWKLNLSVTALIIVLLVGAAFATHIVDLTARHREYFQRMRQLSQFTADVRTDIYQHLAAASGAIELPEEPERTGWPRYAVDDVDMQIVRSESPLERRLWEQVRGAVAAMSAEHIAPRTDDIGRDAVGLAERSLRELRQRYDLAQYDSSVSVANSGLMAQIVIGVSCAVAIPLFLLYLIMVRRWLVRPVEILKSAADAIGHGKLEQRVPLEGSDELAQLARHIDAMAASLARHQTALLEARELTAIGELCTHVAHGLRNPLAAIRAAAQLAERRAAGSDALQGRIRDLVRQVDRLDSRITKLFQFSRPLELRRERTTFRELAAAAQTEIQAVAQSRGIGVTVEDQTVDAVWRIDREQFGEALAELVANAVHHSPTAGRVVVRGRATPDRNGTPAALTIDVIDAGTGMSEATRRKAFDLFFTARPDGTGMGLAMVRRAVEKHAGQVAIASQPGAGTTVTIRLPESA